MIWRRWRRVGAALALLVVLAGCTSATHKSAGHAAAHTVSRGRRQSFTSSNTARAGSTTTSTPTTSTTTTSTTTTSTTTSTTTTTVPSTTTTAPASGVATAGGRPGTFGPTASGTLNGKVVAIDPGHNGGNFSDPSYINQLIWNGREQETCDTTGTETDGGYTEALFNWNVAQYLPADLRALGATVVLTRTSNTGVGPCVPERAAIGNQAKANAAVSIHADGGPPGGRGFAVLVPVADGPNDAIIAPSLTLGEDLRNEFLAVTGEPVSSYDGVDGIQPRDDLGGLNLSTVPKVLIECANMRNASDAALVTSPAWQARAAAGIAAGLEKFLVSAG